MGDIAIQTNQFLTFRLGDDNFAVEITQVREVLDHQEITRVPKTPTFLLGVINLRGRVVPVVDLRLNLGLPATERTVNTCILIVEIQLGGDTLHIGALADAVREVIEITEENISPPPKAGIKLNTDFIKGMGKRDNDLMIILDMDRILTTEEIEIVESAASIIPEEIGGNKNLESSSENSI